MSCVQFVFWEQKFQEANEIASLKVCPHFNGLVVTITKLINNADGKKVNLCTGNEINFIQVVPVYCEQLYFFYFLYFYLYNVQHVFFF